MNQRSGIKADTDDVKNVNKFHCQVIQEFIQDLGTLANKPIIQGAKSFMGLSGKMIGFIKELGTRPWPKRVNSQIFLPRNKGSLKFDRIYMSVVENQHMSLCS